VRRYPSVFLAAVCCALCGTNLCAQTSLTCSSLALQSAGSTTLSGPGYLGTYLTVPAGGATVNFDVLASEQQMFPVVPPPRMNLVIADSKFSFDIASPSGTDYVTPIFEVRGVC